MMKTEIRIITPELAKIFLTDSNTKNRKINKYHVKRLADDMVNGRWVDNGASITWDAVNNIIIDGQHRLSAIVLSGVSIQVVFVSVMDGKGSFLTTDIGRNRSSKDAIFTAKGLVKHSSYVIATLKMIYRDKNAMPFARSPKVSNLEICELFDEYGDDVVAAACDIQAKLIKKIMLGSVATYIRLKTKEIDEEYSNKFFYILRTGIGSERDITVLKLRQRLFLNLSDQNRFRGYQITILSINAWNNYVENKRPNTLVKIFRDNITVFSKPRISDNGDI